MWMLAHLRITIMVRDWVLSAALRESRIPAVGKMLSAIRERREGVLHPSSSPTREVFEHVETYMRARVELRLLVREVKTMNTERFKAASGDVKKLSLDRRGAKLHHARRSASSRSEQRLVDGRERDKRCASG